MGNQVNDNFALPLEAGDRVHHLYEIGPKGERQVAFTVVVPRHFADSNRKISVEWARLKPALTMPVFIEFKDGSVVSSVVFLGAIGAATGWSLCRVADGATPFECQAVEWSGKLRSIFDLANYPEFQLDEAALRHTVLSGFLSFENEYVTGARVDVELGQIRSVLGGASHQECLTTDLPAERYQGIVFSAVQPYVADENG